MSLVLLILGLVTIAAGAGMVGFGIPINEFGLGNTLIGSGVTALTGGLILIGLAAAVRQLHRIAEGLTARTMARPMRPGEPLDAQMSGGTRPGGRVPSPAQRRSAPPDNSASDTRPNEPRPDAAPVGGVLSDAIERLRSNIPRLDREVAEAPVVEQDDEAPLSPRAPAPKVPITPVRPIPAVIAPEPRVAAAADAAQASDTSKGPRLEFPWRTKPRAEPGTSNEAFDKMWPPGNRPAPDMSVSGNQDTAVKLDKPAAAAPPLVVAQPAAPDNKPPEASTTPVAILKSGVVDGMAYTLYADGSIEAKLPEGMVRFGSIADLRNHLEQNS